ncbi:MAG: NAD(P)-dependent oxidoreductase [Verrucomicrobiota bacterium]
MRLFEVFYSGDYLDASGKVATGYCGEDLLQAAPHVRHGFLLDQSPVTLGAAYGEQLYSMQMEPHHAAAADGIVLIRPYVRRATFANGAERLVVIGRAGVGTDKIDLAACTDNDVAVFNAPDSLTHSTASAAMLFILALAKRLPGQERMARSGDWRAQATVTGDDLVGQTLGIVGLGRISWELIRLLEPFGMRVVAYSRHCRAEEAVARKVELVDLDTLLREADYVSLHCALTDSTRGFMGAREFGLMKPTACFINTGRGELVKQDALVRVLQERRIAGAGLDVFAHEPLAATDPLTSLDHVILTPHWLPTTQRAVRLVGVAMAKGILRAARGQVPENVVNPEVLKREGFKAKLARFETNG